MSTTMLPRDRTFVDPQRKIIDPWHGVLKQIEPLLKLLTPDNIAALTALISGAANPDENSTEFSLGSLPVDTPLVTEDYLAGTKTSENGAGRRYAMSDLVSRPALLSSVSLSGNSTQDFVLPSTYNNLRFLLRDVSTAADATLRMQFSSDGGANFILSGYHLFNEGGALAGPNAATTPLISGTLTAARNYNYLIEVFDVLALARKFASYRMMDNFSTSSVGMIMVAGAGPFLPLNLIRFSLSTSTWDAGTIDMWGIP